jgi:regulatory protein
LRLLARRAHARLELHKKLERRGYEAEEVALALARLAGMGYLDDAAFAGGLVRRRSAGRGPLALSAELARSGVDRATADAALELLTPEAQLEAARRLAKRLYVSTPPSAYRDMRDRIGAKLLRRGFGMAIARAAVDAALAGTSDPADA